MRPDEVVIDLVHGDDGRVVYLDAPHYLLPLPEATIQPFQDVVEALTQRDVRDVLTRLVVVVELGVERFLVGLEAISYHDPGLLVAYLLGLLERSLRVLNLTGLGNDADEVEPGALVHHIPEPMPLTAYLELHLVGVPDVAQLWFQRRDVGFNDLSILRDPTVNGAVVYIQAIALLQVICDLSQRDILEVQIEGGGHNARVVLHALKSLVRHEFPRARLAEIDLLIIGLAVLDYVG